MNVINTIKCLLLGHKLYYEAYAQRRTAYRHRHPIHFYRIIHRTYCPRCGLEHKEIRSGWMRRAILLKFGWCIEK